MENIRFCTKLETTDNGYRYRGFEIVRKQDRYFGTAETVWVVGNQVFGTLKSAKEHIDRKVLKEYIEYREDVAKKQG